jgi:hypothetical protein
MLRAAMKTRGEGRRGSRSVSSFGARKGWPGRAPDVTTSYSGAVCRTITSATSSPVAAATSARSGPSYRTGTRIDRDEAAGSGSAARIQRSTSSRSILAGSHVTAIVAKTGWTSRTPAGRVASSARPTPCTSAQRT